MTIIKNPPVGRIIRQQEVGEDGMKMKVLEEIGIGGILISPFYGLSPLGMRPMTFTTLSACAYLIPRPKRSIRLRQWQILMLTAVIT